ncbi:E3 ubiquitin-protein ligase MIB2-like [Saccostrea echinata]|uniref:E3 ubiquitin-protein ligase MIB2-like n=1 Tax=Saccostrea echinata TaxID=191078 RepID=UPI002A7FA29B|nr:E3 ubiquitin-protein ligase MIB2-like [Saccostrea echinata]
MMWSLKGVRVVRGPDWSSSDVDGGEGYVGTITQVDYNEERVTVVWDIGREVTFPYTEGKYYLLVLDNSPAGIIHKDVSCTTCKRKEIPGMRWVCLKCKKVNLCSTCYMAGKHETDHEFGRIDMPNSSIIKVGIRKKSTKKKSWGLFPKAKVQRGIHWKWGDSNGGKEVHGLIQNICDWGPSGHSGAVRVCWENRNHTVERYRVGGDGEVDLMAVQSAEGNAYYPEHLPNVGLEILDAGDHKIGDKVQINLSASELRVLQSSSDIGWQEEMTYCVNNTGTIIHIPSICQARVQYQNGLLFNFQKFVLHRVHRLEMGDLVRVMKDKTIAFRLQQGHGGWSKNQDLTLGRLGRIVNIDDDGDVSVTVGDSQHLYSPVCLDVVDPNSLSAREKVPSIPSNLHSIRLFDFELGRPSKIDSMPQLTSVVKAAARGNLDSIKQILKADKRKVDNIENGVTGLQVASNNGHEKVVKFLLERGADINKVDKEGNTPLHFAVHGQKTAVIKLLLEQKADSSIQNSAGQTALHLAIDRQQIESIKALVIGPCDVHVKDSQGDTSVHAAIRTRQEKILNAVLRTYQVKFHTENTSGYDMLQWAVYNNFKSAVELILARCSHCLPELVNRRMSNNGFTALHIAAFHNFRDCAHILITKGEMKIDMVDSKGQTPLHLAADQGHLNMVEFLVEFDLKVNAQDKNGNSPLHLAQMKNRNFEAAEGSEVNKTNNYILISCLLVEHGAELDIKNKQGKTPFDYTNQHSKLFLERISKAAKHQRSANSAGGISLPLHWSSMENKGFDLVSLDCKKSEERAEFSSVSSVIVNGLPNAEVKEVIRVQNEHLWMLYSVKKKMFTKKYGRGNENEVRLLHGTKSETAFKICEENFDFRIAGENLSPMYGKGVYFATEPSLSDHYCSEEENNGLKYMLMARVLAGKMGYGSPELRKPPDACDCVVDYPSKPRIYCVFDFNQLYPEYVIKYKLVDSIK